MKIMINNEEVLCDKNIEINEEMLNTSSVILNNVFPKTWDTDKDYTTNFYYPPDYSKCLIYDDDDNLLFCGVVKNTGNISLNPREPHYCSLQVLSFKTFLSEGETLDFVIANKTIEEAIEQVVNYIADYGFELGDINILNPNEPMGNYSTKDKTAYDVFNYIADITQSKWTTRMIDEDSVAIDFYDPTLLPSGTQIEYNTTFFKNYEINNMTYNYSTNDYRNKQIMTSDEVYGSIAQSETIVANGYQTQFNTYEKIGSINSISINGVEATFTTYENKELGATADFYYKPGETKFESNDLQSAGEIIIISYVPIVLGRQIIINTDEVNRISNSTGVNGTLSRYENRNDATTSNELRQIGEAYIKYKGSPEITLTIESTQNTWNVGERVYFNAPINDLKTTYLVSKKSIHYIASVDTIFYTYEMTSNFNYENAINYFDNQRTKNSGNIGAGEYIARQYDIENTANVIFYDASYEEITGIGNNVLDCVLDSPFNN